MVSSGSDPRSKAEVEYTRILEQIYEAMPSVGDLPAAKAVIEQEMPQAVVRGDVAFLQKLFGRLRAIITLSSVDTKRRK